MGSRARATGALLAVSMCIADASAHAGPSATDKENARAYMADGRAKRSAGDLTGALKAFQAANAIMHVPTTLLEVARTESMLGLLIEAREDALTTARSPLKATDPVPFREARAAAQKLADEIEPRIPSIRLSVNDTPDLEVRIDGELLPSLAVGLPRKVDPGSHVIVASAGSVERKV